MGKQEKNGGRYCCFSRKLEDLLLLCKAKANLMCKAPRI